MNFNTWIPAPRGNSVRAQGPVSGLANRACRLPMGYSGFQTAGVAHSGIVARPYSRLPLRGQHRNKVTTQWLVAANRRTRHMRAIEWSPAPVSR